MFQSVLIVPVRFDIITVSLTILDLPHGIERKGVYSDLCQRDFAPLTMYLVNSTDLLVLTRLMSWRCLHEM